MHFLQIGSLVLAFAVPGTLASSQESGRDEAKPLPGPAARPAVPTDRYALRAMEGWQVRVNRALLEEQAELGRRALRLLEVKLDEIARRVPPRALQALRRVPIWIGVDDGWAPCMEYHPSADWLRDHGLNPDKAKSVEIGNAARFIEWSLDQPAMVLHELAHAYHHQVLGHDHAAIRAAYRAAVAGGTYESVLHSKGPRQRAYAIRNDQEYFAEGTEAFFGTNDFYPFVRSELREHDPALYALLETLWNR
jgi:hypothetical protein